MWTDGHERPDVVQARIKKFIRYIIDEVVPRLEMHMWGGFDEAERLYREHEAEQEGQHGAEAKENNEAGGKKVVIVFHDEVSRPLWF